MSLDLSVIAGVPRLLFSIALVPMQGARFQPTGFPNLGAATFQTRDGQCLLVESAQSMANRLELTVWDEAANDVRTELQGLSHVRVRRDGKFLTDTILESHRLNSPYVLGAVDGAGQTMLDRFRKELSVLDTGPIDRKVLARVLLRYEIGSLLHGVFLPKKELAGGRLRVARSISAFIEADGVRIAASGGVKNDHVNPSGDTSAGFGNVPFARDEFTAERITLYVNIDLAQIRGYGLGADEADLLILLALCKLRMLLAGNLRLRTACDLRALDPDPVASVPARFALPGVDALQGALTTAIAACRDRMVNETVEYRDALKKSKDGGGAGNESGEADANADDDA